MPASIKQAKGVADRGHGLFRVGKAFDQAANASLLGAAAWSGLIWTARQHQSRHSHRLVTF